ncbi:MAG: LysM peptidoglycan-binding domain-containing protein [Chloroflexi bacterium]|jgi:LysM repeat protein|nr:LysM peptidoglycan-binding domain-containing protein [Anaerolineaceae bacterium]NMB89852.1 LysM peptidoglycan-binding domain-containing protein [Chloroflexota bacterium]
MAAKDSPQSVIESYRRRQRMMPFLVGGLAVLLVAVGIIILVIWFMGPNRPAISLFASATPTSTSTFTPTATVPSATPSLTATITEIPTTTQTMTPTGPFEYTVEQDDNCWEISQKFEVDMGVLLALNNFGGDCPINPGDTILIPAPGQELPTETPLPTNISRGTKIEYTIKSGETLATIAEKFGSTREAIIEENDIEDENTIFAGQVIIVPVNIATATPTRQPTSTSAAGTETPPPASATTVVPSATSAP